MASEEAPATSEAGAPIRGKPVSGRTWKKPQSRRSSSMVTKSNRGLRSSWAKKMQRRGQEREFKELQRKLREEKREELAKQKEARLQRQRQREENAMRSTQYQVIADDTKIKRMNKKQLRSVKKLQVNPKTGAQELVSPWQSKRGGKGK